MRRGTTCQSYDEQLHVNVRTNAEFQCNQCKLNLDFVKHFFFVCAVIFGDELIEPSSIRSHYYHQRHMNLHFIAGLSVRLFFLLFNLI